MLKIKPHRQLRPGFCGPAVLKMVFDYYGIKKSEWAWGKMAEVTKLEGMGPRGFKKVAREMGFKIKVRDYAELSDVEAFLKKRIPVIVDWFSMDDGHYSVIFGLDDNYVYLADPELYRSRKLMRELFWRVWFDFPGAYLKSQKDVIIRRMIVIYK